MNTDFNAFAACRRALERTVHVNPKSKIRTLVVAALAAVLGLALIGLASCGKGGEPQSGKPPANAGAAGGKAVRDEGRTRIRLGEEERGAAGVRDEALEPRDIAERIDATATIRANQERLAHVSPRVAGKVVAVLADLGERVRQGQPLARIDSIEVGEAQSAYAQASSERDLARANLERLEGLLAERIVPRKDYLRARAELEKAQAVLKAASERRRMLGVTDRNGAASGSVYPLTAPFAGTVIDKSAVLGESTRPDKPLFAVADLSSVWIETNIFEKDLGKVAQGAKALVRVVAYPDKSFEGRLTYLSSVMDKETRTVRARIEVPNPQGLLKLEMFANVAIDTPGRRTALLVPQDAVVLVQDQPTVFVREKDAYEARAVEVGDKPQGRVVLKSGVKPGERVVVSGAYALKARLLKSQIGDDH